MVLSDTLSLRAASAGVPVRCFSIKWIKYLIFWTFILDMFFNMSLQNLSCPVTQKKSISKNTVSSKRDGSLYEIVESIYKRGQLFAW